MASKKITAMPDLAGAQVPTDLMTIVDLSQPAASQNVKSTLNDAFAEITKNITDLTVQFGNGVTGTVSAANKGKLRYNDTAGSFQVSENGGAYQNLLKGTGTATRVAFWSAADELSSDAALYWQNTDKRLGIGVGTTPDGPLDVLADGTALAQQWRQNAGPLRVQMILDNVPEASLGTSTNHTFHLLTNNLQRVTVENGGLVGINKSSVVQAQLQVVSQDATTETLILNSAASPSVNIAEFYNDNTIRFAFSPAANLGIGLSGAGGATGAITLNGVTSGAVTMTVAAAAGTWTLTLPTTDGNASQFLQTDGNGVTSWATAVTGPASPVNSVQFNDAGSFGGDSNFLWDNSNKRLNVGVTVALGVAPLNVRADSGSVAQQWYPNSGTPRVQMQVNTSEGILGTSTLHRFHLMTNGLIALTVEDTGPVGINQQVPAAQLHVVGAAAGSLSFIVATAASTSANIAEFRNDSSNRFVFGNSGILTLGLASTATGRITFAVAGSANTQSLQGADTPAATNVFKWPSADPTVGQVLTASAPAAGVVTLSWSTGGGGTTINPTNGVMPVRQDATTFIDSPLSVASSAVTMTRSAIGNTSSDGLILLNATAAAAGAQQFSPRLRLTGQGWKTTAAAASQTVDWVVENQPVQGAANPTTNLVFASQVNGGGYTTAITFDGAATTNGIIVAGKTITLGGGTLRYGFNFGSIWEITNSFYLNGPSANLGLRDTGKITFGSTIQSPNAFFRAPSAATFVYGDTDAASPVAQTLSVQNVVAGTSNTAGANWTFAASRGTGTGAGGSVIWQVAAAGSSGTSQNALAQAMSLNSTGQLLIAPSTASPTGNLTVLPDNAATNSLVAVARLGVNSTGTAADGFGAYLSWSAETSTTNDTETGRENVWWTTATHASRTSAISFTLVNNATLTESLRLSTPQSTPGSPFVLSVYDGTAPNVWTSGTFAAKLYLTTTTLRPAGVVANFSATGGDSPAWQFLRGRGTNASPTAIQNSDGIGDLEWWGQTSTATNNVVAGARIRVSATENWSAGNNGCQMIFFTANNAGTITDRMYLKETGTVRIGATAGNYNTTTLLQIGGYSTWNTDVVAAIYSGANGTKGLEIIGTNGQTANLLRIFRDSLTPDLLTVAASGVLSLRAGLNTGTTVARVGGTIQQDTTPVSNSGTGETNLMTYSLPANTMGTDEDYLLLDFSGEFVSPTGNSRVRVYFGGTVIFDTTALAFTAGTWRFQAKVTRTSATDQVAVTTFSGDTTLVPVTGRTAAPAETMSGAITIKVTGQGAASDEIFQTDSKIQWWPAAA